MHLGNAIFLQSCKVSLGKILPRILPGGLRQKINHSGFETYGGLYQFREVFIVRREVFYHIGAYKFIPVNFFMSTTGYFFMPERYILNSGRYFFIKKLFFLLSGNIFPMPAISGEKNNLSK